MRIIGGSAKRRFLKAPSEGHGVRPILGRIKKSLFDILLPRIEGAMFLDLYAGSGSVGIEALSRGAAHVTFVDRNPACLSTIRRNLSRLGLYGKSRVVRADATLDLRIAGGPYDLVFMGPPYHDLQRNAFALTKPTLAAIVRAEILKPDALVVGQYHEKEADPRHPKFHVVREKEYGDTRLAFFELVA